MASLLSVARTLRLYWLRSSRSRVRRSVMMPESRSMVKSLGLASMSEKVNLRLLPVLGGGKIAL